MDINVVASLMRQQAKINTLETVNVSLLKTTLAQTEQQSVQLLATVAPLPEQDNKQKASNTIDIEV